MENKVVLITGASQGIGYSLAKTFAQNGYKVLINYNTSKKEAENLAQEIINSGGIALTFQADIKDQNQVSNMVNFTIKNFGHIDCLINNAGICSYNLLIDESDKKIKEILETNVFGSIIVSKYVSQQMLKQGKGKIINISSIWGQNGASNETVYSASKGAINSFTKSLAQELAFAGITVNAIAPGIVNTNMLNKFSKEEITDLINQVPTKRFATMSEISDLALFLASDKADYITGQVITIDGGFTL